MSHSTFCSKLLLHNLRHCRLIGIGRWSFKPENASSSLVSDIQHHRLEAKDITLSQLERGFESRWCYLSGGGQWRVG